ncbi:hypothetical protein NZK35_22440 [Stieleria sp. ICT_E10.1]|uniref:hypothetical protein n=1 Tax=Stieleria sedimenti TaxID=2976331 RepID=UPI0021804ADC|nr:hypothetical protein [Stieleria sedimenti]MCS7469421.1 hypothetical protein [Stieleria sedimenti]
MNPAGKIVIDSHTTDAFSETALLSASIPGGFGVGAAYLDALLDSESGQKIRTIHPSGEASGDVELPSKDRLKLADWPEERYRPGLPGKLGSLQSALHYRRNRTSIAKKLARQIERWCDQNSIRRIWSVLESPLAYRISTLLAKSSKYELVATIWDPPESVARQFGLDRMSRKDAIGDFDEAVAGCSRLGVISEAMAEHFSTLHPNLDTTVMRLVSDVVIASDASGTRSAEFVIAFAGSLYASDEFRMLLAALDSSNWTIHGRAVRVQIMGAKLHHQTTSPACIEFLGYRSPDDVARVMASADCGYVPYWFDPTYAPAVQLCFPSKLITCLSSKTPIFFHGPAQSSPAEFLKRYRAGVACHATDPAGIISDLELLADSDRSQFTAEAERAITEEFNHATFQKRFQFLIAGDAT